MTTSTHPAARWAQQQCFTPDQIDCTIAVVLKILDGKCKMIDGEKRAILAIYDVLPSTDGGRFDAEVHRHIGIARDPGSPPNPDLIHQLRIRAEELIPKPIMKRYKAFLREGLFGE